MNYSMYTKLGLTKKDVDSCQDGDLAMVFTAHLYLKGRSELDKRRLLNALKDFLWETYPYEEFYNLIVTKLNAYPKTVPSRKTTSIISGIVAGSIRELGYEWKLKKVDKTAM